MNEGVCDVDRHRVPAARDARLAAVPRAGRDALLHVPARARDLRRVPAQATGGRMPADQETIRIWGIHGWDDQERFFLFREVLGGGSGGRWYADGSDVDPHRPELAQPARPSSPRPAIRSSSSSSRSSRTPAGRAASAAGSGTTSGSASSRTCCYPTPTAGSSPYGVNGGPAGGSFRSPVEPGRGGTAACRGLPTTFRCRRAGDRDRDDRRRRLGGPARARA